jgi:hypothetical protein
MSTSTEIQDERTSSLQHERRARASAVQSSQGHELSDKTAYKAWVANAPKAPMVSETVDLGPFGAEDVEVAVEHCGLCHSDLSLFNNEWGELQVGELLARSPSWKR